MGPDPAVNAVFYNRIQAIEDPDERAAFVPVGVEHRLDELLVHILAVLKAAHAHVNDIASMTIYVTDMAAYRGFLGEVLSKVPGIRETHTYAVMERVKDVLALK